MSHSPSPLLDPPELTAERFAAIEAALADVLGTRLDIVLLQAEAILALEAVARGVGAEGRTCLNVVTGPYAPVFGSWLREEGTEVLELRAPAHRSVDPQAVAAALAERPDISLLVLTHAEAATGVLNPLAELAEVARGHGATLIVDAVASAGAHELAIDELGIDFCVVGPQKGLGGPAGVSATVVSERGWELLRGNPRPRRSSSLALLDWRELWIDAGRRIIPGTPAVLEMLALEAACERVLAEGAGALIDRHQRCAAACRAGVRGLGTDLWVAREEEAVATVTTVKLAASLQSQALITRAGGAFGVTLVPGYGDLRGQLVRIDHMGPGANPARVLAAVAGLGGAMLDCGVAADVGAGVAACIEALRAQPEVAHGDGSDVARARNLGYSRASASRFAPQA